MHKHLPLAITLAFGILVFLGACNAPSDDSAASVRPTTTKETVEAENCVLNPPKEPVACTMQYDPVCGCDGKTYGNACSARGAGVPRSTPGACEKKTTD